ncbi:response regulator transcription factor [Clostridium tarantellae]|uniref:Stage 0 sporulation protein A homolog n=1 Tax=Clostridium tarantellae TaxID=39493 RepID=A0A6I1MW03_9CLOT|nr:response regulator transcription factor [Clostridium tarantellae]MPQ45001.1 response regulator [Clostridium tarantellae]
MDKIVIIEDNEKIRKELKEFLERYGYEVKIIENFNNIVKEILEEDPKLVLLDINLPVFDGYYICREIRRESEVPIIVVTSRDSEMDELMSMSLGADDFVTKPYNTQILLARISALLKRTYSKSANSDILTYKNLKLNLLKSTIIIREEEVELTKNELKILTCLMKSIGTIVSRDKLMDYLWDSNIFVDDNTLTVNINRLRKKLEGVGVKDFIETRRGLGYIMP